MGWTKNFGNPTGRFGKLLISSMNKGHTPVSVWGLEHIDFDSDTIALDIGCGGGMNVHRMLEACPKGQVYGLDISQESVNATKTLNKDMLGTRCFVEMGSADTLPYSNSMFDVVTAFETIYFWPDIKQSFQEIYRVLKSGSRFMIVNEMSDPNTFWNRVVEGMNILTKPEIEKQMEEAGFTSITTDTKGEWICVIGCKE